jgi:TATA-binding protein-associated factor
MTAFQVACMVLASWFRELRKNASDADFCQAVGNTKSLNLKLIKLLSCNDPSTPNPDSHLPYAELARTYAKMRGEAALLLKHAESVGIFLKGPSSPLDTISAENAIDIAMKFAAESTSFHSSGDDNVVESMRQRLLATAGYLKLLQVPLLFILFH